MRSLSDRIDVAGMSPEVARTFSEGLLELAGVDGAATGDEHALVERLLAQHAQGAVSSAPFDALWPHAELFLTACVYVAVIDGHYGVEEARRLSEFAHQLGFSAHRLARLEAEAFRELQERGALMRLQGSEADRVEAYVANGGLGVDPAASVQQPEAGELERTESILMEDLPTGAVAPLDGPADTEEAEIPPAPVLPEPPVTRPRRIPAAKQAPASPPDTAGKATRWTPPETERSQSALRSSATQPRIQGAGNRVRPPFTPLVTGSYPMDPPPGLAPQLEDDELEATEVTGPQTED